MKFADELVSRVMKDEGQEQIVQVVKVIPPERPPEWMEQIGDCSPQIVVEKDGMEEVMEVQLIPQKCLQPAAVLAEEHGEET